MQLFLFILLILLAEIFGTVGGFGSSVFVVPLLQFLFDFQTVLALTGILHVFSNTSKLILFWRTLDWKLILWLGVPSVLFSILGALLIPFVHFEYAKFCLGIFLIGFSVFFLYKPEAKIAASNRNSVFSGSVAGFLAGFIGTGGPVRGLALASFNLDKNIFVGTSSAIDFGVDLSRSVIYLNNGFLAANMGWYILLLAIGAWLGSYLGKKLLGRLSQEAFKKIALLLILAVGIVLVWKELPQLA